MSELNAPSTTFLALWGAVLSTILALWNLYKDFRDRVQLRIEVLPSMELHVDENKNIHPSSKVTIHIFNDGRRACTLFEVGYVYEESLSRLSLGRTY